MAYYSQYSFKEHEKNFFLKNENNFFFIEKVIFLKCGRVLKIKIKFIP
jgi:hypothetical protein